MPLVDPYEHEAPRKITDEEREFKAYRALRDGRAAARHEGKRKARQAKVSHDSFPKAPLTFRVER